MVVVSSDVVWCCVYVMMPVACVHVLLPGGVGGSACKGAGSVGIRSSPTPAFGVCVVSGDNSGV